MSIRCLKHSCGFRYILNKILLLCNIEDENNVQNSMDKILYNVLVYVCIMYTANYGIGWQFVFIF